MTLNEERARVLNMSDEFRKGLDKIGKGGVHCYCCNDFKGKEKPKLRRIVRARMKQSLKREVAKDDT